MVRRHRSLLVPPVDPVRRHRKDLWRRGLSADIAAAVLLIAVPIAFNVAFLELGRAFDYPDILRKEPDEILRRFAAGGAGLILRWEALLLSALAMLPLSALLAIVLGASPAMSVLAVVVGAGAALVQA